MPKQRKFFSTTWHHTEAYATLSKMTVAPIQMTHSIVPPPPRQSTLDGALSSSTIGQSNDEVQTDGAHGSGTTVGQGDDAGEPGEVGDRSGAVVTFESDATPIAVKDVGSSDDEEIVLGSGGASTPR